ncbi:MAG: hypothetical protein ALECFALPRED_003638 [Alectoria fallacina]|uniref:TMEM205-like domain-containing protein n=1 Tax=Alectoria fallacina TaxID=1903189 RepID=A0A8H3FNQ2_9LECA|nr:MAG: hypothetical protein ALECFALPRED_003638 [Alectoria fallacina]
MPLLALFAQMAFYHLFLLAFLLGAQIYQSFFANITASNAITRAQFGILQAAIWPMYFKLQMVVSVLLALTYPGHGEATLFRGSTSLQGVFDEGNCLTVMLPLMMMIVSSATNAFVLVPTTIRIMWKMHVESAREDKLRGNTESQSQEEKNNFESVRDRKAVEKEGLKSPELKALTSKFLYFHLTSYACNLATIATSICYAMFIAERCL